MNTESEKLSAYDKAMFELDFCACIEMLQGKSYEEAYKVAKEEIKLSRD